MESIISEIMKLRGNNPIIPDRDNNNKYCIISNDNTHKTAYCFSVPVYGHHNCELLKLRFEKTNDFVLKLKSNNGLSVLATGDSYFAPPILEICYR